MNMIRQIWIVTVLGIKGIKSRLWQSSVIVVGMACVAGVLLTMMSMTLGLAAADDNVGDSALAIVRTTESFDGGPSNIPRNEISLIVNAPGLAHAADGAPLADPETFFNTPVKLSNGGQAWISVRGIGPKGFALRPELHLVAGRLFRPGVHELIVGVKAEGRFRNMKVGDKLIMPDGEWPIVGSFTTGDLQESMLFGDTDTLMSSIRRQNFTTVLARAADFETFRRALASNPTLHDFSMRQGDWNRKSSGGFTNFLSVIVYGVGLILAIGALFGCFNTMSARVDARSPPCAPWALADSRWRCRWCWKRRCCRWQGR